MQSIAFLAPPSVMAEEFRAQVFASMLFTDTGPIAEAKLLRAKLASQGVHLHIVVNGAAREILANCDACIAMATKHVSTFSACCTYA